MSAVTESTQAAAAAAPPADELLSVERLNVGFRRRGGINPVVRDVSFSLRRGRCLALVGESGSGKSVTARTLVGLAGEGAVIEAERLELEGSDLLAAGEAQFRSLRGSTIGFVLQDALVSLDPLRPVGAEVRESLSAHGWGTRATRREKAVSLLESVGIPLPQERAKQRPGELSGGLRQRALIASAVALAPDILIADEPTTALDVSVQAQILRLFGELKEQGTAVLLISHDLAVVSELADDVAVMQGGRIVESGPAADVLGAPRHPYTKALLAAVPGVDTRGRRLSGRDAGEPLAVHDGAVPGSAPGVATRGAEGEDPVPGAPEAPQASSGTVTDGPQARPVVLEASGLRKVFASPSGAKHVAVNDVSFALRRGSTLGIVGESGSGKSTTARLGLALEAPDAGDVSWHGTPITGLPERKRRGLRARLGVVPQDPLSSFDPRWNTRRILLDALPAGLPAARREARLLELLDDVGLDRLVLDRFPLTLSGGQRQRISIARALAGEPDVVVLDEAVSALDVSVQAQILDLLVRLREEHGPAYLFITHDLGVVAHLADDVLVMKDGAVVERGAAVEVLTRPRHPYTQRLVAAVPSLAAAPAPSPNPSQNGA
ncbi:ABC transporter ATP-binding protein [Galactobacter valiniphilus]|uniref:ABC transporter ATP-binding protein n=1 Tax=Galactobacter valiniphilus TaxID=2676122 RepID=A0A399J8Q3_9MICC|nr:ABC transporter ATP-binding protein [Galactobacter valiniphilus]RII41941.1 ABC transporter ATP-binding protein [Galactobacter valiniphilus]